jgi:hypothetical protein
LDGRIPEEAWIGKKVNYSFLRLSDVKHLSILTKKIEQRLRQNPRSVPLLDMVLMILVIAYEYNKIIRSRDVIFNEKVMYKDHL